MNATCTLSRTIQYFSIEVYEASDVFWFLYLFSLVANEPYFSYFVVLMCNRCVDTTPTTLYWAVVTKVLHQPITQATFVSF